jgi:LPS sulfotransferase NodH
VLSRILPKRTTHLSLDGFPGRRGYAICTTPRSGSNFLCDLLSATGQLGRPVEYFNLDGRRRYDDPAYPDDRIEQIKAVVSRGATANGIYALKLFPHQHEKVARRVPWYTCLPDLAFVHLERHDTLAQAISLTIAAQTGRYRSSDTARREPVYDGRQIRKHLNGLVDDHRTWRLFFALTGIEPLRLTYEDVSERPAEAVKAIAALVGVPLAPESTAALRSSLEVQRSTASDAWRKRFLDEYGISG